MFRKARLLFTLLCAGSTSAIMIIMSFLYLHVSEQSLYESRFRSFQNDISTITASLEQSNSVSIQWLSRIESQNSYTIYMTDNDTPFLYNSLHDFVNPYVQNLLSECLTAYDSLSAIEKINPTGSSYSGIWHTEFEFTSPSTNDTYYASLINIERNSTLSQMVILSSHADMHDTVTGQRVRFVLIDLAALSALFLFSWFFTGRLLKPLQMNQENQMRFIAAASHELRTPLSVILASNECCQSASPKEQAGFSQTIRKEGKRMNNLIDDMLTLAHSGMNRFLIDQKPTEPDTLCLNAYEAFEPLCRQKNITLSLCLPKDPLTRCNCDSARIAQVLSILLHNAVSYTPEGGQIELALTYCRERRTSFEITVTDTGIGISQEDKRHIFDRFYRAEKSRSAKGHFGLGLSIAYEIIKAHGGSIQVTDAEGGGSIFTIIL